MDARLEHEYIANYKLLQNGMKKVSIEKVAETQLDTSLTLKH